MYERNGQASEVQREGPQQASKRLSDLFSSERFADDEKIGRRPFDWWEGDRNGRGGATREYYNSEAGLAWKNRFGDWVDADDVPQGDKPIAVANIGDTDKLQLIEWDVTKLVHQWMNADTPNRGFLLRTRDRCKLDFGSRESADAEIRPILKLELDGGDNLVLPAIADTYLNPSTAHSLGRNVKLRVSDQDVVLVRFELPKDLVTRVETAALFLNCIAQYGSGTVGVFQCSQDAGGRGDSVEWGLATNFPLDAGIGESEDVFCATGFEESSWEDYWPAHNASRENSSTLRLAGRTGVPPLLETALHVEMKKGSFTVMDRRFSFEQHSGQEPSEVFFRYYLRLGKTWNQTLQGGKLPGISGTYGRGGWGGRKAIGSNGWSARGLFLKTLAGDNPLRGLTPIGVYCYHADMVGNYGDNWVWCRGYRGYLENERWYCIEHHIRLNEIGKSDGLIEGWIDGRLAFRKADVRFRTIDTLKIQNVWMNVYHGGVEPSPYDQDLFFDNLVVARKYIGPIALPPAEPSKN
ncbi:polysaccharide lyase [Rhodopirellula sallentina]|uniref:polysaccharide lyase n=1 Tax=Rhodopirellula sallentina TaxID=1263869 RepID=UPI001360B046|nr:DNRLRE domain-containing protein [Rhodopirellula sallentina]